jgi:hypothetical protein
LCSCPSFSHACGFFPCEYMFLFVPSSLAIPPTPSCPHLS